MIRRVLSALPRTERLWVYQDPARNDPAMINNTRMICVDFFMVRSHFPRPRGPLRSAMNSLCGKLTTTLVTETTLRYGLCHLISAHRKLKQKAPRTHATLSAWAPALKYPGQAVT